MNSRDAIYEEVMRRGWNPKRHAFVQSYDSESLDAANLVLPLVFFLSPTDPRMLAIIEAIKQSPSKGGLAYESLVRLYNPQKDVDGLLGGEGSFNMCTFWLVGALTRAGLSNPKQLQEAQLLFEQTLGYANHLGLCAEETGPCGEACGNFPQALTHLALISAAFNLDRALGAGGVG
jgi:GH15 family glucan-1,4-alpha-glucosidase